MRSISPAVIVSGGSGLYLRAALADMGFPDAVPDAVRLTAEARTAEDLPGAIAELRALAPALAAGLDTANPPRVTPAPQLALAGVRTRPADRLWSPQMRRPTTLVGVDRPKPVLDELIARRVGRELDEGLVPELEAAIDTPGLSRTAAGITGVREVLAVRAGALAAAELPAALAARTRRLARAQRTWLRKLPAATILDLGDRPATDALPRVLELAGVA